MEEEEAKEIESETQKDEGSREGSRYSVSFSLIVVTNFDRS